MRIASLTLARYGHFEEMALACPRGTPDLHLVVGDNEAGKTTIRHALMDLLFGIQPRGHPYAFEARVSQLRLEAEVETAGAVHGVVRTSSTKQGLSPAEAAVALAQSLGGMDRALYSRARAFSHDEMRAKSDELHTTKGELRDLLMASVGGLERADALLRALEARAGSLFDRRGNRKTDVRELLKQREEALGRYEGARLSAEGHRGLREAVERARGEEQAALQEAERVRGDLAELEALIGAERMVERLRAFEAELAALPERRMRENAETRVQEARNAVELARAKRDGAKRVVADWAARLGALEPDAAVLEKRAAIAELTREKARRLGVDELREKWHALRRTRLAEASRLAGEIGLSGEGAALANALVPRLERRAALRLMRERGGLEKDLAAARASLEAIPEPPAPVPDGPSPALTDALALVDELGKVERDYADALRTVADAEDAQRAAEAACRADPRCDGTPPPREDGVAAEKAAAEARARLESAREALRAAREDRAQKAEAAQSGTEGVPTREALQAAREARDDRWERIVAGAPLAEAGPRFRAAIDAADRVADARFDAAHKVAAVERAVRDLKAAAALVAARETAVEEAEAALDAVTGPWAARLAVAGLAAPPADYAAWSARRQAAAAAADAARAAKARADAMADDIRHAAQTSARAVDAPALPALESLTGPALLRAFGASVAQARAAHKAAETARNEALAAHKAYRDAQAKRPDCEDACRRAEAALGRWDAAWAALAARLGLDPQIDLARLEDLLGFHETIEESLAEAEDARRDIESDDAKEAAFAAKVEALASALGESLGEGARAAAERLAERLAEAERVRQQRDESAQELEKAEGALASAEAAVQQAMAETAVDREAAGLPRDADLDALLAAARRSDRRRTVEAQMSEALSELAEAGLAWPEIGERLVRESGEARRARKADLEAQLGPLGEAAPEAAKRYGGAARALRDAEERSGVGDAHRALAGITTLSAALVETAAEAIDAKLRVAVLGAARKAFADRRQSPVLERAERIFATLTGGRYTRLQVENQGADDAYVQALRPDGRDKRVSELSDGTRDQLVMAVRLAALEDDGLPFIADDLFVNADDRRAGHGFQALAEAARGRQVFYLTHHHHLADIAQAALGAPVNVIRLPAAP